MPMTSLAITGASGFLGLPLLVEVLKQPSPRAYTLSMHRRIVAPGVQSESVDLRDKARLAGVLRRWRPEAVIHLAAETRVDWCERNPLEAVALNVDATRNVVEAAREIGAKVVFMSTDSVFNGTQGNYREDDAPGPLNVYADSKLQAERIVLSGDPRNSVLRANFFGWSAVPGHGLAEWVLQETQGTRPIVGFENVVFTPILSSTLARVLLGLTNGNLSGLFHAGCLEPISKYRFACEIADALELDAHLITAGYLGDDALPARRPLNTSLDSRRLCRAAAWQTPSFHAEVDLFKEEARDNCRSKLAELVA